MRGGFTKMVIMIMSITVVMLTLDDYVVVEADHHPPNNYNYSAPSSSLFHYIANIDDDESHDHVDIYTNLRIRKLSLWLQARSGIRRGWGNFMEKLEKPQKVKKVKKQIKFCAGYAFRTCAEVHSPGSKEHNMCYAMEYTDCMYGSN